MQMEIVTHSNYLSSLYGTQFASLTNAFRSIWFEDATVVVVPHLGNIFSKHFEVYFSWMEVLTLFLFKVIQSTGYSIRSFLMYAVFHFETFQLLS